MIEERFAGANELMSEEVENPSYALELVLDGSELLVKFGGIFAGQVAQVDPREALKGLSRFDDLASNGFFVLIERRDRVCHEILPLFVSDFTMGFSEEEVLYRCNREGLFAVLISNHD